VPDPAGASAGDVVFAGKYDFLRLGKRVRVDAWRSHAGVYPSAGMTSLDTREGWTMFNRFLTSMDIPVRPRTVIALVFAVIIALVCVASFVALVVLRFRNPEADVELFLNIFLTSLGYIVGILTGLLGLKG
jgi:hypothetical protein